MKKLWKTIGVVLVSLVLVLGPWGCGKKGESKQISNRINQLAEKVADLSKDLFPRKMLHGEKGHFLGTICIGKDPNGSNRYAVIEGWKADRSKNLEITVCADLNPELEEKVNKHLSVHNYAETDLSLAGVDLKVSFEDSDLDGLTATEIWDKSWTRDKWGKFIWVYTKDLSASELKRVNEAYGSALETIEPVLKKLKEDQEGSGRQEIQTLMENIAKLGLTDYNTTKTEGVKPTQPAD